MTGIGENTLAQPVKPPLRERRACLAKLVKNRLTLTARTAREKLAAMPTDADIDFLFSVYSASPSRDDGGPEWGDRAVWEDLHHRDPYPFWLD